MSFTRRYLIRYSIIISDIDKDNLKFLINSIRNKKYQNKSDMAFYHELVSLYLTKEE